MSDVPADDFITRGFSPRFNEILKERTSDVPADNFVDEVFTHRFNEIVLFNVLFNETEKERFSSMEERHPRHPGLTARKKKLWL